MRAAESPIEPRTFPRRRANGVRWPQDRWPRRMPKFAAVLAASTASATDTNWPLTLGGATVTVTDSAGASLPAQISYASPTQVNYRVPVSAAAGIGKVVITAGGAPVSGTVNIVATYPGVFKQTADGLAAAQIYNGTFQTVTADRLCARLSGLREEDALQLSPSLDHVPRNLARRNAPYAEAIRP